MTQVPGADAALIDDALALCRELAAWAGPEISSSLAGAGASARTKTDAADWVTEVDVRVERHVRAAIAARFPRHRIRGEEGGEGGPADSSFVWCVDPVDGTGNYANGLPWSSFSVALLAGEEPLAGAVVEPYRQEVVSAARGRGLFVDALPWTGTGLPPVTGTVEERVAGRIVMLELANARRWPGMEACMSWLEVRAVTARIMGSSALSVTAAALGRAVAAVLPGSNAIDVGAGVLFAREAGLVVLGRDGRSEGWPAGGLVAAPPGIAEALWEVAFGGRV